MVMEGAMTEQGTGSDNEVTACGLTPVNRRDVRRLAMQVLYQMDVAGLRDRRAIIDGLDDEFDNPRVREQGTDLALAAWASRHGRLPQYDAHAGLSLFRRVPAQRHQGSGVFSRFLAAYTK